MRERRGARAREERGVERLWVRGEEVWSAGLESWPPTPSGLGQRGEAPATADSAAETAQSRAGHVAQRAAVVEEISSSRGAGSSGTEPPTLGVSGRFGQAWPHCGESGIEVNVLFNRRSRLSARHDGKCLWDNRLRILSATRSARASRKAFSYSVSRWSDFAESQPERWQFAAERGYVERDVRGSVTAIKESVK